MTTKTVTLDMDTVKLIAAAAAREAVEAMREENRREADRLEARIEEKLNNFFGSTTATAHVVQHARLDKLLNFLDSLGANIFGTILKNIIIGLCVMGLIGYFIWNRIFG